MAEHNSFQNRMFLGNLDDSVSRFPWEGVPCNLQQLNRSLIFYALLGPPLCCRAGNLIYHADNYDRTTKEARKEGDHTILMAVRRPEISPLLPFAKSGFFQLQSKENSLNASIEARLAIKTNSTMHFAEQYEWKPGGRIFRDLEAFDSQIEEGKGRLRYDPQFIPVFKKLCSELQPDPETPFGQIFHLWRDRFDLKHQSRSNFEILVEDTFEDYARRAGAMHTINSINHYAYGIAISTAEHRALIETKELTDQQRLTRTFVGQEERILSKEELTDLTRDTAIKALEENLAVPERLFKDYPTWVRFAELLDPDNGEAAREYLVLKSQLLHEVEALMRGANNAAQAKRIARVARDYSKLINTHLDAQMDSKVRIALRMGIDLATSTSTGMAAGDVTGWALPAESSYLLVQVIAGVVGFATGHAVVQRSIDFFRTEKESRELLDAAEVSTVFQGLALRKMDTDMSSYLAS